MKKKRQFRQDASRVWAAGAKLTGPEAAAARERMIKRQRGDSRELLSPEKSETMAEVAKAAMLDRMEQEAEEGAATVEELMILFKNGKLTPEKAYSRFLELGDESKMTAKQAKAYFFGREDAAGARERMLRRMGFSR